MLFACLTDLAYLPLVPIQVDGIELRFDHFKTIPNTLPKSRFPLLFTLRKTPGISEEERESLIKQLFSLKPAFFDLEITMRPEFLDWAFTQNVPIVLSYHNFEHTPSDLESIYASMKSYPAYTYKLATHAKSTADALRLLLFSKKYPEVTAIPMGEKGEFGRVLGSVVGNRIDYAYLGTPVAPGQLSVSELLEVYHYRRLSRNTALFGLIGDPVAQSRGHLYHNQRFEEDEIDAVYVKMSVSPEELSEFLPLAKQLGFRALSVTMPLKEKVVPDLGSINTLFLQDPLTGISLDGTAALDAIGGSVEGKNIVLIGAGGAARSIAIEAKKRGAHLTILNRSVDKAITLAQELNGQAGGLDQVPLDYDILINCTPHSLPIQPECILPKATIMDLTYTPRETPFLQEAQKKGARIVYGDSMFENQASAQFDLWKIR